MKQCEFVFDTIFKQKLGHLHFNIETYKKIYNLEEIQDTFEVSKEQFEYSKRKSFFSVLCIYNEEGKIYLHKNFHDNYRALPGGSILNNENIHTAVRRTAQKVHDKITIGEIEPIALITNTCKFNQDQHTNKGIVFMARVRNFDEIKKQLHHGDFLIITKQELCKINKYANSKAVQLVLKRIKSFSSNFPENEIAANEKYGFRYTIHNNIVKRFLLTPYLKKKREFNQLLLEKIGNIESIIDVSCGDNGFLNTLIKKKPKLKTVVGNDISRSQIDLIKKNSQKIIYTNHNAVYLPFKEKSFDVAYCANTLHHMTCRNDMENLLQGMFSISKKILIVEIERPKETGWFPHILNKYRYIGFLKDTGGAYLSQKEFEIIITDTFSHKANIQFSYFRNIQGKYMIAEIENSEDRGKIATFEHVHSPYEKIQKEKINQL